jgi:hypothetical protein
MGILIASRRILVDGWVECLSHCGVDSAKICEEGYKSSAAEFHLGKQVPSVFVLWIKF